MIEKVTPVHGVPGPVAVEAASPSRPLAPAPWEPRSLPDAPPEEVLAALDAAQGVIRELERTQVRLRFQVEETEAGRRVRVDVVDAEGRVIRTIPPSRLASLLQGRAGAGLVVDEHG